MNQRPSWEGQRIRDVERERNRFKGPDTQSRKAEERTEKSNRVGTRYLEFERRGGKDSSGPERLGEKTVGTVRSLT